jgi:BASS family bile acid:Na+ symporter
MMDRIINVLVLVTLIEMMLAIGLGVTLAELVAVARNLRLVTKVLLANYVWVPVLTIMLILLVQPLPVVTAGFLMLAVCPGAPFGPPCTTIAKGDTPVAVGLMAILAASSALVAPLLLYVLLLIVPAAPPAEVEAEMPGIDATKIIPTLLITQIVPLALGLALRYRWPAAAARLQRPANGLSAILSLILLALIFIAQFHTLWDIRLVGFAGMLVLLAGSLASGWLAGGPGVGSRRAVALTTSLRNVGVALVIATGAFPGTAAVTAVIAYGLLEIVGSLLVAVLWGRTSRISEHPGTSEPHQGYWRTAAQQR